MKYIRTKTKIETIESALSNKELFDYLKQFDNYKDDLIKVVDTIPEVCDGFWWEDDFYKDPIFMFNYYPVLDRVKAWKESDKELLTNEFARISIYASIYIKGKGWMHVAKMKGILPNGEIDWELL